MVSDTRKVYCLGCRWLSMRNLSDWELLTSDTPRGQTADCHHPDNLEWVDTWLRRDYVPKRRPREINANNDCPWHEEGFAPGEVVEVAKGGIVNYCPRYKEGS